MLQMRDKKKYLFGESYMKKKIMVILLVTMVMAVMGCGGKTSTASFADDSTENENVMEKVGAESETKSTIGDMKYLGDTAYGNIEEYRDNVTGVHYFVYGRGGITVRYNTDGTIFTD